MPVGAISNPVRVPGGFSVVTLQAKREIGNDMATDRDLAPGVLPVRHAADAIRRIRPTSSARHLRKARSIGTTVKGCEQMEAFAKANNPANRPIDPGEVRVEGVNPPAFRQLLETIPLGKPTEPLDFPRRHRGDHRLHARTEECRRDHRGRNPAPPDQ